MSFNEPLDFRKQYVVAWYSQERESVSLFFSEVGPVKITDREPAVKIRDMAMVTERFLHAFPNMLVSMESLPTTSNVIKFHGHLPV